MSTALAVVVGFLGAAVIFVVGYLSARGIKASGDMRVVASIQRFRSVGELVVFKIITKEVVTTADHWFGEFGKKYLSWLVSNKKMVMVFEFEIDFRYDLRNPDFKIRDQGNRVFQLKMPKCFYQTHIRSVKFYDETKAELLPWLLPDLINNFLDSGFDGDVKNKLVEEARHAASAMAKDFVQSMRSEVQNSARETLQAIGKGLGADEIEVDFTEAELVGIESVQDKIPQPV